MNYPLVVAILLSSQSQLALAETLAIPDSQYSQPTYQMQYQDTCRDLNLRADWARANGRPLDQFNWSELQSKSVVLIGDAHGLSNPQQVLELVRRVRSGQAGQCFFFEMPSDLAHAQFEQILNTRDDDQDRNEYRDYFRAYWNSIKSSGMRIEFVDDPEQKIRELPLNQRDSYMANRIHTLLSNGACRQAIMLVGKEHIAGGVEADHIPLATRLRRSNLKIAALNPMHAADVQHRKFGFEGASWNGLCPIRPRTPPAALIFPNGGIAAESVLPNYHRGLKFGAFDYSVLFP